MSDHRALGPTAGAPTQRLLGWLMLLTACCCLATSVWVFARREFEAQRIAALPPGTSITSGCEEESHFAIWRSIHGEAVYLDATKPPFAAAYFNWLFYRSYAAVCRPFIHHGGPSAMIVSGRLFTALGALTGAVALGLIIGAIWRGHLFETIALATFAFGGPLVGWWAFTVRPDVWALACEVAAIAVLLRYRSRHPYAATILTLVLLHVGWAFKQSTVNALATVCLFLLVRREYRHAALLAAGSALLWAVSFALLGPDYRAAQHALATANAYSLSTGLENLISALTKSAPFGILCVGALLLRRPQSDKPDPLLSDARMLGWIGAGTSLTLGLAAACKFGAATNYFFFAAVMLAIAGAATAGPRPREVLLVGVFSAALALQLSILTGKSGRIELSEQAGVESRRWSVFSQLPEPRFSADSRLQQPWLNPHSPPYVLAFKYDSDLQAGRAFEGGGIGGLIESGYFAALLLPEYVSESYLGGRLTRYVRHSASDEMVVYLRRSPDPQ